MSVCVLIMSNDRRAYLKATWASACERLFSNREVTRVVVHEDSGNPRMWAWLRENTRHDWLPVRIIGGEQRQGFGGAIRYSWNYLTLNVEEPYIFHLEDDFTFNEHVPIDSMIHVLDTNPHIAQLALRRQPWSEHEKLAGGVVEQHPTEYTEHLNARGESWLEHRLFWTTNPSLYRRSLCAIGWPEGLQSEGMFTHSLIQNDPDLRFAYYGTRDEEPRVHHIGDSRMGGKGY